MNEPQSRGLAMGQADGPEHTGGRHRVVDGSGIGHGTRTGSGSAGRMPRSRIGIITGSGPEAGVDLWTKLLRANRMLLGTRYGGDLDAPEVVIFSVPELGLSMELARNDAQVWQALQHTATQMAAHVDHYAIACNTLNHYADRLDALGLPARLVSVGDVVRDHLAEHGIHRVALLAALPVMDLGAWSAYRALPLHADVERPADVHELHEIIYEVKRRGGEQPDIVERFARVLAQLESDVALLACTELPLIPCTAARPRCIDVTDLLALALARLSLTAPADLAGAAVGAVNAGDATVATDATVAAATVPPTTHRALQP
jgi:aspartate racemase